VKDFSTINNECSSHWHSLRSASGFPDHRLQSWIWSATDGEVMAASFVERPSLTHIPQYHPERYTQIQLDLSNFELNPYKSEW